MSNQPFRQLLQNRNFLKLWISQMFSQFTIQLMNFYVLTRIFALTQSSLAISFMWLSGALPALLFGPFSGAIVDNFSRRRMMLVTNLLQAFTVSMAIFAGQKLFFLYLIVFFYWFFDQFYFPSQQASTPMVVPKELLTAANGLFLFTQQISILVGFGLGGILLTLIGDTATVLIASINLVIAAIAVTLLPHDSSKKELIEQDLMRFWNDFRAGYKFLKNHRTVLFPILMLISSQVFITVISTLLPSYVRTVLGLDLKLASITLIVPGAVGALLVIYLLPKFHRMRQKDIVQTGLFIGSVALVVMSILGIVPYKHFLSILVSISLGGSVAAITAPIQSLVQRRTPRHLHGRIYGQMSFLLILATTLPLIISAAVADLLGISAFIGILAIILFSGYLFMRYRADYVVATGSWF